MATEDENPGNSSRPLRKQGEEAIGKLAQELLQNPMVTGALTTVFETRERATRAQEVAMSALNLPSAADIERLTRRVRSVAQRIEGVEDNLDQMGDKLTQVGTVGSLESRLEAIESALGRIETQLAEAATAPAPGSTPTPTDDVVD
jgi:UrcA family protein